ncbi:armadillo-type protein [Bisporella sp. PMI_857]|nr:armadillo-type protein [Bisporella sp. PMI_857]
MSLLAWEPDGDQLLQLSIFLRDSLNGKNKNAQKEAEIMLAKAKSAPEINNYLAYLFSSSLQSSGFSYNTEDSLAIRSAAAIMLKNNIKTGFGKISKTSITLIRSWVPNNLQDKNSQIRNYAGNIIAEMVISGGILEWPEILPDLISVVDNVSGSITQEAQEGAMAALSKICEDNQEILNKDEQGQRTLNNLIPKLIEFTRNPVPNIRCLALASINIFIRQRPAVLLKNLDVLLDHLFLLATDPTPDVHKQLCRMLVQLVEVRPDKIKPHIAGLVDYIITQQKKVDEEDLTCEAAEFWFKAGGNAALQQSLAPHLRIIIPVLLDSMVYCEEDIIRLEGGEDDADEEDRAEDMKPTFAKGRFDRSETSIDDNPEDAWNLRKISANALRVLATQFSSPVIDVILPSLVANIKHKKWPYREAAAFTLGSVADSCAAAVAPHLRDLIPSLITLLGDEEPLVRQITCWTLGCYSSWVGKDQRLNLFQPMMEGILAKMLDPNKKVQEAGASAFAHLEDNVGEQLIPYCYPVIEQFVRCFKQYKDRNMVMLYDCVGTLAKNVGNALAAPAMVDLLMPALIHRWNSASDQSHELIPLLECLSSVVMAQGDAFRTFAPPLVSRCIKIIHQNLDPTIAQNADIEAPNSNFLVTAISLLSAIIQVLNGEEFTRLVCDSKPDLFELLTFCIGNATDDGCLAAYELLGYCAKYVFSQLRPSLPGVMPSLIEQLNKNGVIEEDNEDGISAVNNACWSAGEICIQSKDEMTPYAELLLQSLLDIIQNPKTEQSVNENAIVALGRLGLGNSQLMAPHISVIATKFLGLINSIHNPEEKASALIGFTLAVEQNPRAMENELLNFFSTIARYNQENEKDKENEDHSLYEQHLRSLFAQVLNGYKEIIPDFGSFLSKLEPQHEETLRRIFQL